MNWIPKTRTFLSRWMARSVEQELCPPGPLVEKVFADLPIFLECGR